MEDLDVFIYKYRRYKATVVFVAKAENRRSLKYNASRNAS